MIYFDTQKEAFYNYDTIIKWGRKYLTSCTDEEYADFCDNKLIWEGDKLVQNPNYEQEQEQKERERISHLKMTKRVFALGLQDLGITYSKLKELIATNEQAQLEWELCVELERSNPLLDIMASKIGVTSKQLDDMFRKANGEVIEIEPLKGPEAIQDVEN